MVRLTDKPFPQKKAGPARRVEKADKSQENELCGWNLPIIPDDNDIISWMKREKNGDNNRKKINGVYEEEQYRHNASEHCGSIENKLLFDRQSLHDRYLKNCQFGVRVTRVAAKTAPVKGVQSARDSGSQLSDRERHCFSASILDDGNVVEEGEEEDEENGDAVENVSVRVGMSRGRSHSAVCHSASLRSFGMTLPDAGAALATEAAALAGAGTDDYIKDEGEDPGWDEGYGSKVSSNDQEQEEDNAKALDDSEVSNKQQDPEAGPVSVQTIGAVLQPGVAQPLNHQEAMARLMYSRRERTVYERLPSRRMRGNSFRYAGREQSRLTEASLNNITPAYLARYYHLADLANMAQAKQAQNGKHPDPASIQQQQQQQLQQLHEGGSGSGDNSGSGGVEGLQPRTMVLRKITIQDSSKDIFSQNIPSRQPRVRSEGSTVSKGQASHRRQGLLSPPIRTQAERSVSDTRSNQSNMIPRSGASEQNRSAVSEVTISGLSTEVTISGLSTMTPSGIGTSEVGGAASEVRSRLSELTGDQVSIRVQELTPDQVSCATSASPRGLRAIPSTSSSAAPHNTKSALSAPSHGDERAQGGSPQLPSPSGSERLTMSTFAMTDLLPAVERNIRIQRHTQRGMTKTKTMDVTASVNNINIRRQQNQQQQQQQQQQQVQQPAQQIDVSRLQYQSGEMNGAQGVAAGGGGEGGGGGNGSGVPGGMSSTNRVGTQNVRGFPAFRPYQNVTPLQRAKELANRRMHGHLTQLPDGSETVRVPSPQYASRTDQRHSYTRAKSASRLLGQVLSRQTVGYRYSAV